MGRPVSADRLVSFSALFSILVGLLGLAGCFFHLQILRTVVPGMVAIAANSAFCFILLGVSLWCLREREGSASTLPMKWMGKTAAAIVGITGFLSLAEFLGQLDFGIDQLLFPETTAESLGHVRPGLMSPVTALDLVLLGLALLLLDWTTRRRNWPAQVLCFIAGIIAAFTLVDLIVDPRHFRVHIALPTVIVLTMFPFAVICARPKRALGGLLLASGSRRAQLRQLIFPTPFAAGSHGGPLHYLLAVILVAAATIIRQWSMGHLPPGVIFITYFPAVMIAALVGGFGPGILATVLSVTAANYFFLRPEGTFTIASGGDLLALLIFTVIGVALSWLASALERTREEAGEEIRRAKEEWELTFNSVPEAVMVLDSEFRVQRCNKAMAALVDLPTGAITGKHCYELVHQQSTPVGDCPLRKMLQSGGEEESEITEERLGKIFDVSATPLRDGNGMHGCVHVIRDITERKRAEQANLQLASIVTSSDDAIVAKTLDGIVTSWNGGAEKIYGCSAAEAIGQPISRFVPPDRLDELATMLDRVRRGIEIPHHDTVRLRKDGRRIDVAVTSSPIKDQTGKILGISTIVRDITQQKKAEGEIRKAFLYARSLLEASLDPLVTISREGKITDVNEAAEKATGIGRDQLIGSDFSEYFTEPEKARQGYQRVFAEGFVQDYPLAIRHTSGRIIDVLYNATVFRNEQGDVEGVFAAARDITERKRAEEQVRKSSLYARSLIESSLDPLVTISREGKITDVNQATEKATGISREQLVGSDFCDYFTEPDKARQGYRQVFDEGFVRDYPLAIRHTSGHVMDVLYNATVFKNVRGEVEGIFAAARDITERKRAEQALAIERQRFRDVLDKLPVYVVLLTPDYHVALDNTVFRERFGESHGRPCYEFLFHRDSPCEICDTYKVLKTGGPQQWKWTGPDGRHYDIFDFPFTDSDGSPLILEMGMDVTERERAEAEVFRLNEELEQRVQRRTAQLEAANKELEAFTYSVSHDLRAPLRHISGFSKILMEDFESSLPEDAKHHLKRIDEGTRRMGILVDDLLNLARIGRRELSSQVCGMRSIVDEIIVELKPEYENRQIEWKIGSLPFVECDAGLMKQVFLNLLTNALKFTRPRDPAVIEIGQQEDGAIFVRDNGVGFSMKYADKLFGVFQRLHRSEDFEGTGVGLATVQRIIHKHGGRIWAHGELDKGASFYFTLRPSEKTEVQTEATVAGATP